MDRIQCEAFLAAAEQGSFTAAAELLGYTQSGITRMIGKIEEELGFDLFIRTKQGVQLTENGRIMLPRFRELELASRNVDELSADIKGNVSGVLTIGSYYSVSAMWMPMILKQYRSLYPGVRIRMQEGGNREMARWLSEHSVDLCFCAEPREKDVDWIPICQDEIVAWLPKSHPLADAAAYPVKALEKEPFIHTSPKKDTELDRMIEKLDLHLSAAFSTRDAFTTYNMVAMGLGVSFNQRLISLKWNREVAEVPFDPPEKLSLGLAVPSLKSASPAAGRFIELVKKIAAGPQGFMNGV